jgi:hypothetical protein
MVSVHNRSNAKFRPVRGSKLTCDDDIQAGREGFCYFLSHHEAAAGDAQYECILILITPADECHAEPATCLSTIFKIHCFHLTS